MANTKTTQLPELTVIQNEDWIYVIDKSDLTDGLEGTSKKISKFNLSLNGAQFIANTEIASYPTGDVYTLVTEAKTYTDWGGIVVGANKIAILMRIDGVFSSSQNTLVLTDYVLKTDVVNTLVSTETEKPLSAAQGKALNEKNIKIEPWTAKSYLSGDQVNYIGIDWVSNAATISTDVPNVSSKWVERLSYYGLPDYVFTKTATFRSGEIQALKVLKNIEIECSDATYLKDTWSIRAFTKNLVTVGFENYIELKNTRTGTVVSRNFSSTELTDGFARISIGFVSGYSNMFANMWFDYSLTTQTGLLISSSDSSNIFLIPNKVVDVTSINSSISTINSDIAIIESDIAENTTAINEINSAIKETTITYETIVGVNQPVQGFFFQSSGVWTPYSGYLTRVYDIETITNPLHATSMVNGTGTALAVYFNSSMVRLGMQFQGTTSNVVYTRQLLTIPVNTKYVALCYFSSSIYPELEQKITDSEYVNTVELKQKVDVISARNQFDGKKVVWLGTSVPFGVNATKSYAQEVANKLGFTLVNASVPGQAIHSADALGTPKTYGSTVCSKAEYAANGWTIQTSPVTPYVPGGSYNNFYRTWENIFISGNADADLWVFDVAPNNTDFSLTDWNLFNKTGVWGYSDSSTFASHRTTFIGAILFLMDKMYALNPNARMVFLLGSDFAYSSGKTAFETISAQWNIPIIDIWKKINQSQKSLEVVKSLSGTDWHPSTFAHEKLGEMLANELILIS